jgi:hypothetical protein
MSEQTPVSINSAPGTDFVSTAPGASALPEEKQMLIKLDLIAHYLQNMDQRDRIRTIGGTIRSLIMLIPTIIVILSTWYIYEHSEEIMQRITEATVNQALSASGDTSQGVIERMREVFGSGSGDFRVK